MASLSDYPPEWPARATEVKEKAGWRLASVTITPIISDMTLAAETGQVGEAVRFFISLQSEFTKRNNMCDGKLFVQFFLMNTALLTRILVSVPGLSSLILPVGAIIVMASPLPMRAVFPTEMSGKPLQPTFITTETFIRNALRNLSFTTTPLARVCDIGLFINLIQALAGTMNASLSKRNGEPKFFAAYRTHKRFPVTFGLARTSPRAERIRRGFHSPERLPALQGERVMVTVKEAVENLKAAAKLAGKNRYSIKENTMAEAYDNPLSPARLAMAGETLEALARETGKLCSFRISKHYNGWMVDVASLHRDYDWKRRKGDTFPEAVAALLADKQDAP